MSRVKGLRGLRRDAKHVRTLKESERSEAESVYRYTCASKQTIFWSVHSRTTPESFISLFRVLPSPRTLFPPPSALPPSLLVLSSYFADCIGAAWAPLFPLLSPLPGVFRVSSARLSRSFIFHRRVPWILPPIGKTLLTYLEAVLTFPKWLLGLSCSSPSEYGPGAIKARRKLL